jgi:hypothetical protein
MMMKLGDAVAKVAEPIARGLDRTIGPGGLRVYTASVEGCEGCKGRQARLNELSDDFVDFLFSRRNQPKETRQLMKYNVTQMIVVEADSPQEAIAKMNQGEMVSLSASVRREVQPQQPGTAAPTMTKPGTL